MCNAQGITGTQRRGLVLKLEVDRADSSTSDSVRMNKYAAVDCWLARNMKSTCITMGCHLCQKYKEGHIYKCETTFINVSTFIYVGYIYKCEATFINVRLHYMCRLHL